MQTEWGFKTRIQHVAPLSKIKSKARPAKKAESTEEFDLPLAGMMIDSGQQGRSSNVHVKIRAYDMLILMFFYHGRGGGAAGAAGGKIIFHKPHPIPKIGSIILHSMGRRMAKWFGWHRELFVLDI